MSYLTFKKVRAESAADEWSIKITLFRGKDGVICGWYVGPLTVSDGRFGMPYLPKSAFARASVAIVRAMEAAKATETPLCLIDPDDLWEPAWQI